MFGRKKSVEDIVRPLTKIVDQLQVHADTHHELANEHLNESARRKQAADDARDEALKANAHAGKIASLIS